MNACVRTIGGSIGAALMASVVTGPSMAPAGWRSRATWSPAAYPAIGLVISGAYCGVTAAVGVTVARRVVAALPHRLRRQPHVGDAEGSWPSPLRWAARVAG
jgi:hypothetical protein